MWRVLGIIALVWIGFMLLGAVLKFLTWALVIGLVVFVGWAGYAAIRNSDRKAIR